MPMTIPQTNNRGAQMTNFLARSIGTLILIVCAAVDVRAQAGASSADRATVSYQLSVTNVRAGETLSATVTLNVATGWHVQAAVPSFDYLVPTRLTLEPPAGVRVSAVQYPPAKTIEFAGDRLAVYDGIVPLRFSVKLPPNLMPGPQVLRGQISLQACDNKVCLAPATVSLAIPFEVVHAGAPAAGTNIDFLAAASAPELFAKPPSNEIERLFGESGTLLALLAIFFVGLALNLTPCVYPMLSVTVAIFGVERDPRLGRVFFKAVLYVLGIATMYSALGTFAALTGGLFGAVMQSPWVLLLIALLLAALALSMFGLYEIRLPSALMSRLGRTSAVGLLGVYFSGLVVGVFAAPCIGPPIIALLALVGARGDPWFGFGSFFVLALGLGAPYLVLGTFSGLLKRLPRSGAWLVWVRKVFGVVLLGVAFFYAALGFFPGLLRWAPILALALGGVYIGFLERSGNDRAMFRRMKRIAGLHALGGALVLLSLELPVRNAIKGYPRLAKILAPLIREQRTTLEWQTYQPERIAAAKAAQQPVVLDFYADWCIPCHELDRNTFSDPEVQRALRDYVRLKVDLTRMDSPEHRELIETFQIQGVPTVIFLDQQGQERPDTRVLGYLPPVDFLSRAGLE